MEQVNAHAPFPEKAAWLAPLILLHGALPSDLRSAVDALYRGLLADPADVNSLWQLLTGLGPVVCASILTMPDNIKAMHDQAARLEARFTAAQAPAHRERILDCFPPEPLLKNLGLFDEERTWDLVLFSKVLARGKKDNIASETLRNRTAEFIAQFVSGKSSVHIDALDGVLAASKDFPELLDEQLARALAQCCVGVVGTNVEKYIADLRFLGTRLSTENRLWLANELINSILKPRQPQWVQVLQKMTEDVTADQALSMDKLLVENLNDYAFEAARVSPHEAATSLTNLFPHLPADYLQRKLDEAQDRVLALEAAGPSVSKIEPYLALFTAARSHFGGTLPEKLQTFCSRMLGTAKTDEEKKTILDFLNSLELTQLSPTIQEPVAELASAAGALGDAARILQGSMNARDEPPATRDQD